MLVSVLAAPIRAIEWVYRPDPRDRVARWDTVFVREWERRHQGLNAPPPDDPDLAPDYQPPLSGLVRRR